MCRPIIVALLAAAMTVACATHQTDIGGYYCKQGTNEACAQHEGDPDCQPCPHSR